MPFATTWMELEIIILSEVSQTEKDKYRMVLLTCGIFKNDTNEHIYKTEKNSQAQRIYGYAAAKGQTQSLELIRTHC